LPTPVFVLPRLLGIGLFVLVLGCSHVAKVENQPLAKWEPDQGYAANFRPSALGGKLRVVLAFSGGGTRASALSYGVLKELRDTFVEVDGDKQSLLEGVTTISSVSGGSFTSAYYGLHGERIFDDFEERFLRKNITAKLALNLFRPLELLRFWLTPYTRSDMAIDVYDREVFDGATFADLAKAKGPMLNINATDIDVGAVFTFMQPRMDRICSDLSTLRVSQAVTASSAVPGIFAPLRLENFAGSCGYQEPEWIREALANPTHSRRRYHNAKILESYLDQEARPNVYLVDGGVADNIGARVILADVIDMGGVEQLSEERKFVLPESILYIVVNAQVGGNHQWAKRSGVPDLKVVLGQVSSVGIYRYNFETIELLREATDHWSTQARQAGKPINAQVVEVAFENLSDPDERKFFDEVKTSFDLDGETVDRLIEVGGRLLRDSPEFQKFMKNIR
jgi:NTE family protein